MLSNYLKLVFVSLTLGAIPALAASSAKDDKSSNRVGNRTIERTVQLRTHSIYAPYIDEDLQNRWWDFGADAYINTNKHVRLTRNLPSQTGWLWSRLPVTAQNFEVEVEFKISGSSTHLFGDGMAMWLTKTRAMPGPIFGSVDEFDGIAIVIDTYANARHAYSFPRILAVKGDGKTKYDLAHDADPQAIGACSANVRRTNVATKMKVTYLKDQYLDVKLQYKAWDDWQQCFRIENVTLPAAPFLGFSAITGDVHDAHDIIAVTTSSAILSSADAPRDRLGARSRFGAAVSTGSSSSLLWLLFIGVVAGGGWYGYKTYYIPHQRRSAKFGSLDGGFTSGGGGFSSSNGGFGGSGGFASGRGGGFGEGFYSSSSKRF